MRLEPASGLVVRQSVAGTAAEDLQSSVDLLRAVASGHIPEQRVVRLYTPRPTLALSRRESRMPGFERACASAERLGFEPAVRPTGGRAVAYDESCLIVDVVCRDDGMDQNEFFARAGHTMVDALRALGVDARVGPVAGEYCPGEFSINSRGVVKLMGTSQRAVRGARLLSGMLALGDVGHLVEVLVEANRALELEWRPETFGTLTSEAPHVRRADLEASLIRALLPLGATPATGSREDA
ncbi:biotin/lipoate A/B protein ligase family protein [Microbacterium sp. B2969]|uniref:Biotin/lipoate A/B protein ligase family protein n=1 Tax=Microbacterium alkaliflavum TaxID=3248839 RepID=A0ABW7QDJ5_9MICO